LNNPHLAAEPAPDFSYSDSPSPHTGRRRQILAEHPEAAALMGRHLASAAWIVGLVALQWAASFLVRDAHWLIVLLLAYGFGAFVNHALYVLMHECTHNLVTERPVGNKLLGIVCDMALFFPSALAFRKYHMLHHKHLGHLELDPDVVSRTEADLIGASPLRKAIWLCLFSISQGLRPYKVKSVSLWDGWIAANIVVLVLVNVAIFYAFGPKAIAYLACSTLFALGLHPLGGRWIQEHYTTKEGQETYSYYGPLNKLCFNMGFHNEHHDFPNVSWANLPRLTKLAPEHYLSLKSYQSWTAVVLNFIFNPKMSGYSRIVRADSK
jgi:sphingolipid delta-4 desaturase